MGLLKKINENKFLVRNHKALLGLGYYILAGALVLAGINMYHQYKERLEKEQIRPPIEYNLKR